MEGACLVEYMHLSLIPTVRGRKIGVVAQRAIPVCTRKAGTSGSLGLASQPSLTDKLQVTDRPCLKENGGLSLRHLT